ncbi:MAG: hypothetical protein GY889_08205 [Proteobacteria bacterium]|jgi:hypothetical protein|nr:hypothetical protein [Pseudomonadota bacterium]
MSEKYWRLTKDKLSQFGVQHYGSGHPSGDTWHVCIRWTNKLGLRHSHDFSSASAAEKFVERVKASPYIMPEYWTTEFYPFKGWENHQHID